MGIRMEAARVKIGKNRKQKAKRYLMGGKRRKVKGEMCLFFFMIFFYSRVQR